MKLFKDLKTAIQKDKKKGFFLGVALLIIGFGIFQAVSSDKEELVVVNKQKIDVLPMPELYDSTESGLDKATAYYLSEEEFHKDSMLKNSYNLNNDEYFTGISDDNKKNQKKEYVNQDFDDVFGKKSPYTTSSPKTTINYQQKKKQDENQNTIIDTKRRRIPSDNGTMLNNDNKSSLNSSMIKAVISNGNKSIKSGSTIRVRISEDCFICGLKIPKNTLISGICSFTSERVKISINSINFNNQLLSTNYSVFEMDGIEGVYIPGGIKSEILKEGVNEGVNQAGAKVNTPIGTFGINSIKKGVREPSVLIRDGHKIILKFKSN